MLTLTASSEGLSKGWKRRFFSLLKLRNDRAKEIDVEYVIADLWQAQNYQRISQDEQKAPPVIVQWIDRAIAFIRPKI